MPSTPSDPQGPSTDHSVTRRLAVVAAAVITGALLSLFLPEIGLDTGMADAIVRLTDTGGAGILPILSLVMVAIVTSRPGLDPRRRLREAAVLTGVMLLAMSGGSALNEQVIKPAVGVPRPNIVALAQSGVLGPEILDGDAFYDVGSIEQRRSLLTRRLTPDRTPFLSPLVRARWIRTVGYSMPSGHATAATTLAVLCAGIGLAWLTGMRRVLTVLVLPVWAVAITWSRVLLRVHTGADVAMGATVGATWGAIAWVAFLRFERHVGRSRPA